MIRGVPVLALGAVLTNGILSALSPLCRAERAPQTAVPPTNDTQIAYSGGKGTSFKDAVVIQGATNIIDLILAERRWLSNNYPGFHFSSVDLNWRLKTGVYDVIEIRTTRRKEEKIYFRFSEKSLAETPIDALWAFYVDDLIHPHGIGIFVPYHYALEEQMKRIDPRHALPFLVLQLKDTRLTNISFSDVFGDGKPREQRVCDFATKLLLGNLRYARSKEAVFPQYSSRSLKPLLALERPNEAIEAIKKWWEIEGEFLVERGEVEWTPIIQLIR